MRINSYARSLLVCFVLVVCVAGVTGNAEGQQQNATPAVHLYFFTNHGCAPCRQVEPGIQALSREGYPVSTVYVNEQPQLAQRYQVNRTPTVIMVADSKVVGRHAGIIDGVTLKNWFAAVGVNSGAAFKGASGGTKVPLTQPAEQTHAIDASSISTINSGTSPSFAGTPTMHQGTTRTANSAEARAMRATVRLKVEDPEGISYATGTIIHAHNGECLVMTCGHVFRDAGGKGEVTAELGFADGQVQTAPGQLISYDAEARDIGLVAIRTSSPIQPVTIGRANLKVDRGQNAFSIGCDHGKEPTIRHTQIKNRAAYDGSIKYDIYGRPVDGRSGGGLFNSDGELIGVCNAAAVEVDEGIYTALETIHWQIAHVNLQHLFETTTNVSAGNGPVSMPVDNSSQTQAIALQSTPPATSSVQTVGEDLAPIRPRRGSFVNSNPPPTNIQTPVSLPRQNLGGSDMEVIILVRSKSNPADTHAITVDRPSKPLLDYLSNMRTTTAPSRQIDVAQLRKRIEYDENQTHVR